MAAQSATADCGNEPGARVFQSTMKTITYITPIAEVGP
jgi:hypothetical protein